MGGGGKNSEREEDMGTEGIDRIITNEVRPARIETGWHASPQEEQFEQTWVEINKKISESEKRTKKLMEEERRHRETKEKQPARI